MGFPASIAHVRNYAWLRVYVRLRTGVSTTRVEDEYFHVRKMNNIGIAHRPSEVKAERGQALHLSPRSSSHNCARERSN